jgi:Cupin
MAKHSSVITFIILALLMCHGSVAQFSVGGQSPWHSSRGPAGSRECRFEKLDALQPSQQVQHEAGRTEHYDEANQMFRCAGVSAQRYTINPRGLLLPTYSNAPSLIYIERGNKIVSHSQCYISLPKKVCN